ncbi:MAG: enoyl-CoA hydratase [Pseudonocardiaceae bacterium]|nr:enoyl-CoA hydratase [Pseudonocardiaceae bacterium]
MTTQSSDLPELAGRDLGTRLVDYTDRDVILYALAVGAPPDALDLVYERDLHTLPAYGTALGLWAVETAGQLGAYDPLRSLHAAQRLAMHEAIPTRGPVEMSGRVADVWDKGKAAMVDIEVTCVAFTATYSIFLPGYGGWGGQRGPSREPEPETVMNWRSSHPIPATQAALYRLTGDRHPVHIDPTVATHNGFTRPILHGLCTLGTAARMVATAAGSHPTNLTQLHARFAAPVLPGQTLHVRANEATPEIAFTASADDSVVISGGRAVFRG